MKRPPWTVLFRKLLSRVPITIPFSVTAISTFAFSSCTSLTIYCEAASKPDGWSNNWNASSRPVQWGYSAD